MGRLRQGSISDLSPSLTHLIALERVGPSRAGRCYSMRGRDITDHMAPAHRLFEKERGHTALTTIGIGDGGNEIGMGKIPSDVIGRNIPNGELIACRVPTDHLIVCGVSNWGAYALAAGVALAARANSIRPCSTWKKSANCCESWWNKVRWWTA